MVDEDREAARALARREVALYLPVVAPLLGGIAGAALYDFGIRQFLRRAS